MKRVVYSIAGGFGIALGIMACGPEGDPLPDGGSGGAGVGSGGLSGSGSTGNAGGTTGGGGTQGGTGIGAQLPQAFLANVFSSSVAASTPAAGAGVPQVETQALVSHSLPQSASVEQPLPDSCCSTCVRFCW
jgi:hypothetical protein